MGQTEAAQQDLRRALILDPEDPVAVCTDATLKAQRGEFHEAIQDVQNVLRRMAPHEDPQLLLGVVPLYAAADDLEGAKQSARRAAELQLGSPEPYLVLANVYVGRGLVDLAANELRNGIAACTKSGRAQDSLAGALLEVLIGGGRLREAEEFGKAHLAEAPNDPGRKLRLATVYAIRKDGADVEQALELFEQLHAQAPGNLGTYR